MSSKVLALRISYGTVSHMQPSKATIRGKGYDLYCEYLDAVDAKQKPVLPALLPLLATAQTTILDFGVIIDFGVGVRS